MNRERNRQVGAGPGREMKVRLARQACCSRVDDHERCSCLAGLLEIRDEMNAGRARIDAPQNDQTRVHVVLVRDARHLSVEHLVRRAGRGRANRPRQPRRAKAAEERRVVRVLRQQPVRTAIVEGQDRFRRVAIADLFHLRRDVDPALRPHGTRVKVPWPFAPCGRPGRAADLRRTRARQTADLAADVIPGDRIGVTAVDADDAPFLDGDRRACRSPGNRGGTRFVPSNVPMFPPASACACANYLTRLR